MGFPLTPVNGQTAIVNGIKYIYISAYKSWRRDFNNVLDRLFLIGGNETVSSSTGDLVVLGGGFFGKSVIIGKDLTVYGTATFYGPIIGSVSSTTNITGGSPGALVYQINTSTTGFIPIGATGTQLVSDGTTAYWTVTNAGFANTATNIEGGDTWQVPFQLSTSTTTFSPDFTYDDSLGSLIIRDFTSSAGTDTGAIVTFGGVGIGENLNVGGNLTVGGDFTVNGTLTYLNTTNLDITDKLITLAKGSTNTTIAVGAGFEIEGTSANFTYADNQERFISSVKLEVPSLVATAGIPATDVNTGTIQVTGGVGVTGNVVAGLFIGPIGDDFLGRNYSKFTTVDASGQITAGSSTGASFWNTATQELSTTASIYVVGGVAVEGNAIIKGSAEIPGGIIVNSTTTDIGLHLISGSSNPAVPPKLRIESRGVGYTEIYTNVASNSLIFDQGSQILSLSTGQLFYLGTADATDSSNGSIATNGGISADKNVYIGGHYNGIRLENTGNISPVTSQNLTISTTSSGIISVVSSSVIIDATTSATITTSTFVNGAVEAERFNEIELSKGLGSFTKVSPTPQGNSIYLSGNGAGTVYIGTDSLTSIVFGNLEVGEDLTVVGSAYATDYNNLTIDYSTSTNISISPINLNQGLNLIANGTGNIGLSAVRVEITATTFVNGSLEADSFNGLTIDNSTNTTLVLSSTVVDQNIEISPNGTGTTIISSALVIDNGVIKKSVLDLTILQTQNNVTLTTSDITANIITADPGLATSDVYIPEPTVDVSGYELVFRNRSLTYDINIQTTTTSIVTLATNSNVTIICDGYSWFSS